MIITRQSANRMTKQTLAELASSYATEFAHLLGQDREIIIQPNELIYDTREALDVFLRLYDFKKFSNQFKEYVKIRYEDRKHSIENGLAFVQEGVAFIPLLDLAIEGKEMIKHLQPNRQKNQSLVARIGDMFFGEDRNYALLSGFGSEVAHLTGFKLYSDKAHGGLGEALDISSIYLEIAKDIDLLYDRKAKQLDPSKILNELIKHDISSNRTEVLLYESLLFRGEEATKRSMQDLHFCKPSSINLALNILKKQYVMAAHYDGSKLFLEIFDSVKGNLIEAYKKLGTILANPQVTNMETALAELGYTPERLLEYRGAFEKTIPKRAERLLAWNK